MKYKIVISFITIIITLFLLINYNKEIIVKHWIIIIISLMFFSIIFILLQYESGKISSKEISLIAILSGFSAVLRIPFVAIPSVQPCTFIIICTGYVFGPIPGFMVGATTALISNIFLGHGPWTIFQIFAWGIIGIIASFLPKINIKKFGLAINGVLSGFLFGWITNLWFFIGYIYPHNISTFIFSMSSSLAFDTMHAIGNLLLFIILGEKTIKIMKRYKDRFHIEYINYSKPEKINI